MKYRLARRPSASGCQIEIDVYYDGKRVKKGTGIYIEKPTHFYNNRVTCAEKDYNYKNQRLDYIEREIDKICRGDVLNLEQSVMQVIKGIDYVQKKRKAKLFVDYLDEYMETKEKQATKVCFEQTKKKLLNFSPRLTADELDYDWVCRFDKWLTTQGMSINGKSIVLRNVRTVVNYCITNEVQIKYPFRRFKIKTEQTRKRNLTRDQLIQLRYYDCEVFHAEYRDMFMLMFYLIGINAVDLFSLTRKNIVNGRLEYVRKKTDKDNASNRRIISIKIEPEAMEIINKYKGHKFLLSCCERYKDYHDYLHHMNDALKRIGMTYRVGCRAKGEPLFPDISSYWSRHTWASLASELDITTDTIGRALGHAYTSVTDTYINFDQKKIDKANRQVIDYVTKAQSAGRCLFVAM
mgnify:CR=1 FL=1